MRVANFAQLRLHARRRLPRMFFDYIDGGSYGETTLRRNEADFDRILLQQRVLRDVSSRSLECTVLGQPQKLPIVLGPVGFLGLFAAKGEVQAARAAAAAGIGYCLSTMSICRLEEVATVSDRPIAFQSYIFRDRGLSEDLVARAEAAGVATLFITVDAAVSGLRERDVANGFRFSRRLGARALADFAAHPRWLFDLARAGRPRLGNFARGPGEGLMAQVARMTTQIDPSLTWIDLAWMRRNWRGRLIVKGILAPDDALRAIDAGADGIVVSNHGGRQLDGAPASIQALPGVARAVDGRIEVLMDGGVRRGAQVIRALALGADAVLLGRAQAFGLAAGGQAGITAMIDMIAAEMDASLALMGLCSVAELRAAGSEALFAFPEEPAWPAANAMLDRTVSRFPAIQTAPAAQ